MKKYLISTSVLLFTLTACYAADLSLYKNVAPVTPSFVTQPTITEIQNIPYTSNFILLDDKGVAVEQQSQTVKKSKVVPPTNIEACTDTCVSAPALADGNTNTTFDFPLLSSGIQKGRITITYAKPLTTSSLAFRTTGDSYVPTAFTLTVDGKRVLNTLQGTSARFPEMTAKSIVIEFEYNQPIRFTEVGVGSILEEDVSTSLRFVRQPGNQYILYLDSPSGRESVPSPAINLFAKAALAQASLGQISKNTLYKERDTDNDNISDGVDNCPMQANTDQKDSNGDGAGDVCDDYDYDGVATYRDNCPAMSNPNQSDVDKDGIGDVCDTDESRTTEKYPWITWAVFGFVFVAVMGMGYEVVRKKNEEAKV